MLVVSTHASDRRHTSALKAGLEHIDAPGWVVVFGDRKDMCNAALEYLYAGKKLIHVGGGDTWHGEGSHPDHRTRDAITMLSTVHCVANDAARLALDAIGIRGPVHVTGAPGLDSVVAFAGKLDPKRKRQGVFEWFPEDPVTFKPRKGWRYPQREFLERIAHAELFKTNSSAGLYEAPILGTPVEWVGRRQEGRNPPPYHHPEGRAVETIVAVVKGYL